MNAYVFNTCLLIGWLMVLAGGCMANLAYGLIGAGALLLVLCGFVAKLAGVYLPTQKDEA